MKEVKDLISDFVEMPHKNEPNFANGVVTGLLASITLWLIALYILKHSGINLNSLVK